MKEGACKIITFNTNHHCLITADGKKCLWDDRKCNYEKSLVSESYCCEIAFFPCICNIYLLGELSWRHTYDKKESSGQSTHAFMWT